MFGDIALETLHARDIGLTEVPAELEQLEELEDLDLSCNNLTEYCSSLLSFFAIFLPRFVYFVNLYLCSHTCDGPHLLITADGVTFLFLCMWY